ncbi:LysR family transcriptional regulator [Acidisphaera rubrifaciens]|uniref:Transcriptional regulator LysR n=1 Tax=Acidisphaera rubrifaciens HS-AP3 TaxID=1231350 RepID=A0A0D6P9D9_9PROT|nr:LysR family transcriptional regulator [Acidisphaera rubrifaciens]GAN77813.1 transcriptional regulator LysR [Acidisphaera rubrifaciens HS-AP3]
MAINLHLLRLFAAVVAARSFSRAAEALHVSQPAVSKGVRELEGQLGLRLLERGPGGVALTEAGAVLAARAATLFAAERDAEDDLAALRGIRRGRLSVGASTTIATYMLARPIAAFAAAHPGIDLHLTSANSRAIAEALIARAIDVALVEGPAVHPAVTATAWRADRMAVIAAPSHPLVLAGAPVPAARLADETFILREVGSGTGDVARAALAALGLAGGRRLEIGSTEAIKQVVAAGFGLAIVSAAAAADQIALGRLAVLAVEGFDVVRTLSLLALPDRPPGPAARAFLDLLARDAPAG